MADNTTNGLVNRTSGLLTVPLRAGQPSLIHLVFLLQILLFQDDNRICHLWIRQPYKHHTASSIVTEVEALWDAAPAHAHQNGATDRLRAVLLLFEDGVVVALDHLLVFFWVLRFLEYPFVTNYWLQEIVPFPKLETMLKQPVAREEYQHAAGCELCNVGQRLAEVEHHRQWVPILVGEVKRALIDALL